eukprot:scaffold289883_cov23-Tisochrysis_lutea.AAC.1
MKASDFMGASIWLRSLLIRMRSASELQVLLDAYSSCVASLSQQQQQQSMITVHEGSSSPDSMPSGACSLPHLEGLLQPL